MSDWHLKSEEPQTRPPRTCSTISFPSLMTTLSFRLSGLIFDCIFFHTPHPVYQLILLALHSKHIWNLSNFPSFLCSHCDLTHHYPSPGFPSSLPNHLLASPWSVLNTTTGGNHLKHKSNCIFLIFPLLAMLLQLTQVRNLISYNWCRVISLTHFSFSVVIITVIPKGDHVPEAKTVDVLLAQSHNNLIR